MMRALLLLSSVFALVACDPGPPKIDDVRIQPDSYYRTDLFAEKVDLSPRTDQLSGLGLEGISIAEGFAIVLRVQPQWKKFSTPEDLPGMLHLVATDPSKLDVLSVPNEQRRFILVGKVQGTTDITVTVDGAQGSQKIPVTITVQKPN